MQFYRKELLSSPLSLAISAIGLDKESFHQNDEGGDIPIEIQRIVIPLVLELPSAYFQHTPGNLIGTIRARIKLHAGKQHGTDVQVLFVLDAVKHLFTATFAKEMQLIIDRMRGNPIPGEIEEVRGDIQQALIFSSDDVRAAYTVLNTADHNDFSVDPGFLIHRIKSAFTRDINIARDPTPAELREIVELFRTRFEGDFGEEINNLLAALEKPTEPISQASTVQSERIVEHFELKIDPELKFLIRGYFKSDSLIVALRKAFLGQTSREPTTDDIYRIIYSSSVETLIINRLRKEIEDSDIRRKIDEVLAKPIQENRQPPSLGTAQNPASVVPLVPAQSERLKAPIVVDTASGFKIEEAQRQKLQDIKQIAALAHYIRQVFQVQFPASTLTLHTTLSIISSLNGKIGYLSDAIRRALIAKSETDISKAVVKALDTPPRKGRQMQLKKSQTLLISDDRLEVEDGEKAKKDTIKYHLSYDVDPDLGLAIGTELSLDEAEGAYEIGDFSAMGIDPLSPTGAKPGSEEKVRVLAARYAAGVPLWNDADNLDHGPVDSPVMSDEFLEEDADEDED